jgi:hypothetical protein
MHIQVSANFDPFVFPLVDAAIIFTPEPPKLSASSAGGKVL